MSNLIWDVENASAGYGAKQVLFDLSLQQKPGELVCLLGHNGAGKSTLLKVLYGLLPARGGVLRHKGHDVTHAGLNARLDAGIAYMPGGRGVFQQLTVAENLRLGLAAAKVPPAGREERLEDVFALFPILREFYARRAGLLSGGQQQMLSLGRTILSRPTCLLLDEPSIGLAPKLFQDLLATIQRMQRQMNMAVLLVEQNVREALAIADRAYVMKAGRIVYAGPPGEIDDHAKLMELY
jgi:ABC-type branched-subunit amino acid transport system ATPase component